MKHRVDCERAWERVVAGSLDPRRLHLILLPTEKCNFRCTYCYENHTLGEMNSSQVAAVKQLLSARMPDLRTLDIEWFGGEPLLAQPVITDISNHILDAISGRPELHYAAGMTTNGFLLDPPTFARLTSLGIRGFQISLDGTGPRHDLTRRTKGASGTFDTIWRNLLAIRQASDIEARVKLRVHFFPGNREDLPSLLDTIAAEFGGDQRFRVHLKALGRLGGPNDDSFPWFASEDDKCSAESMLTSRVPEHMLYRIPEPAVCYAAQANSLVIYPDCTVGKCTVALEDPRNRIGVLGVDGALRIDQELFSSWMGWLREDDLASASCPYRESICRNE